MLKRRQKRNKIVRSWSCFSFFFIIIIIWVEEPSAVHQSDRLWMWVGRKKGGIGVARHNRPSGWLPETGRPSRTEKSLAKHKKQPNGKRILTFVFLRPSLHLKDMIWHPHSAFGTAVYLPLSSPPPLNSLTISSLFVCAKEKRGNSFYHINCRVLTWEFVKKLSNQLTLNNFEKVKGQETYRNRRQTIGAISKNTARCEASCERK